MFFFFFKQKTAYEMRISDWSSDVCSSDLIVEIDRGQVTSWPGDWDNYLRRKEERLNAEAQENARFDKMLAQEEVWIRQGIKARRTRDEGRVRRLKAMRVERAQRREQVGNVRMRSEEHTSELQSLMRISYTVFCLKKKNKT